ncbi:MAG: LptF/LptG family permease [Culturomica sp.]|jgi:lipopolysaccharide export system permease protein|nr:LptF/LptG family permease [Culturomica sp.]
MKKLDLYIIRKFLGTFFFSLALILCIVVIFDVSERLERFIVNEAPLKAIIFDYYLNFIPYFANVFSPLFTFVAVIFFTSKMAYDSEIIAILSTGISFRRFLLPYFISACVIAVFSFTLSAYVIPNANHKRLEFQKKYINKKYMNKQENIHLQVEPGVFIYISTYSTTTNVGYDFGYEEFKDDTLKSKLTSSRIVWDKSKEKWTIYNWKLREFNGDKEIYTKGARLDTLMGFYPDDFSEDPKRIKEQLTLVELDKYIDKMKLRGSANVTEFEIEKYKIWANIVTTFILTLIGAGIASRKVRGGKGLHLGIGLLLSFSYILFLQFSTVFATNGDMHPLLAVWLPNILYAFIAFLVYKTAPK